VALRKIRLLFLSIGVAIIAAACNIQLQVTIDIQEDGTGKVTAGVGLDAMAQDQEVFGNLESILRTSDLSSSGWDFEVVGKSADGYMWYEASKGFLSPEDIQGVLDELTSSPNVFTGWELSIESTQGKRIYGIAAEVDLREGFSIFTDTELSTLLEEPPLGISLESLQADLGQKPEDTVTMQVTVNLPDSGEQSYDIPLGQQRSIDVTGEKVHRGNQILGWVVWALIALLALALLMTALNWFLDIRHAKKQPPRRPSPVTSGVPGSSQSALTPNPEQPSSVRLLVVDMYRVIFSEGNDSMEHLASHIRSKGGDFREEDLQELHRQGTLGRLSSMDFWAQVGVDGDSHELDKEYVKSLTLRAGAKDFLLAMHKRGIQIGVVTNDFAEWSRALQDLYGLQGMKPWIVSAESGVRKPDPAAFEVFRKAAEVPFHACLVIDGSENVLDSAANLGMKTVLLGEKGANVSSSDHPVIQKLSEFTRR
tara:strand:- start:2249 stop:3688 length:1440 start_codon:yes stop_codon:yes gene_type:complete